MAKVFRSMHKTMPEQDTELTLSDEAAAAAAAQAGDSATDMRAQELSPASGAQPGQVEGKVAGQVASEAPPVSRAEYDQLKAERDQLLDRLARLQAEFENSRKRAERNRIADRDYAVASVVEKFLPVLDHFELALNSAGTIEQLRSGVELIVKQMEDVLRQLQVTAIPAEGAKFDPRQHEALGTVERLDLPDQHVAEEVRRGYKLRDKLLRPALVRVASNPKQTSE
ncbi:MAG: nucleotide exchange factor GrpE [Terracidiphilus sp.]